MSSCKRLSKLSLSFFLGKREVLRLISVTKQHWIEHHHLLLQLKAQTKSQVILMPVELEMFLYLWEEQIGFPCLLLPECNCIYRRWRLLIFGSVAILDKLGMEVFYFEADRYIGRLRLLTVCAF